MTLKNSIFPPKPEFTTNFNWQDIAAATGYVLFDGLNCIDSGGSNYTLIESGSSQDLLGGSDFGEIGFTKMTSAAGNFGDYDFDLTELQLPRTIEGTGFVRIGVSGDSAAGVNAFNCIITLRKWDGASETDICTVTSASETLSANENESYTLKLTIPQTHFKKGETIRLNVTFNSTTATQNPGFGHDPSDSSHSSAGMGSIDSGNSRMLVALPFKIII